LYRNLLGIFAVLATTLALVGLTFSSASDSPADFRFINGSEPKSLDPQLVTGQPAFRVVDELFEGLTRRDPRSLRPIPGVAKSWQISPDGRRYVFQLRPEARWSDGRPVTAHDFAYAWRRAQDPATGSEYAYILHMIRFAEAFNTYGSQASALADEVAPALAVLREQNPNGVDAKAWQHFAATQKLADRVKRSTDARLIELLGRREGRIEASELEQAEQALADESRRRGQLHDEAARRFGIDAGVWAQDDHTLVVELVAPTPYFLELAMFPQAYPVPRQIVEAPGRARDWFLPRNIVSNGPFNLESWRIHDRIRMRRSQTYWDRDSVGVDTIDALPIENATTSLNLYLTGEADWLPSNYPNDLAGILNERPDFYSGPGLIVYYYRINTEVEPFDDPRVRKALNLAIDRRLIVDNVLGLGQLPAHTIVPPGMLGYEAPESAIRYDPEEARSLLAAAGFPGGAGIADIGILYNTQEMHKKIAEVIADQLNRNLGLNVSAYNQEWQSYLATLRDRDYTLARAGWIGDYEDPNTFLDIWVSEGGNNQTGWSNPIYDRLIAAAADIERFVTHPNLDRGDLQDGAAIETSRATILAEGDPARRKELGGRLRMKLLAEAEHILVAEAFPIIPIYFYVVSGLVRSQVEGFYTELEFGDGSRGANLRDIHPLRAIRMSGSPGPGNRRKQTKEDDAS
jgi:oligopeptide transport system substrate-binding protein